jgi:YHS domain-containing protein
MIKTNDFEKYASMEFKLTCGKEDSFMAKDPVCGMEVDEKKAAGTAEHDGKTYYFCSTSCKTIFEKSPGKYTQK